MVRSQNNNPRRRRSRRPNGKGNGNIDSSGPSVKVRGSARQVYDKYLLLARDAKPASSKIDPDSDVIGTEVPPQTYCPLNILPVQQQVSALK